MRTDKEPIFERIKTIVPSIDQVAKELQSEQAATQRHHKLLLLILAGLVELGEHVNQSTLDTQDLVRATADLISNQVGNMNEMEQVADKNAGARTVIQNLKVWMAEDPPSIADFLNFVNPVRVVEAARTMPPSRVIEIANALQDGLRGRQ